MPGLTRSASPEMVRRPVVCLPVALYVSNGIIIELYDGGQSCRRFSIQWVRLTHRVTAGRIRFREAFGPPPSEISTPVQRPT